MWAKHLRKYLCFSKYEMFMFTKIWLLLSALRCVYDNFHLGLRKVLVCQDHFKKLEWKTKKRWLVYYSFLRFKDIIQYMKVLHVSTVTKGYYWAISYFWVCRDLRILWFWKELGIELNESSFFRILNMQHFHFLLYFRHLCSSLICIVTWD